MDTDRLIQFTQALVRLPSLSGEEEAVAARIEEEMQALAFDHVARDCNGSIVGVIEGKEPGKTLLFDAHTDTVGISPGVAWQDDPFGARIVDGAIVGRGSTDMKGALAAMIYAAATVDRSRLRGRVVVSGSTLEEVLEGIALQQVMEDYPPDFVVIGESSDLTIVRGGRGRAEIHLTTTGKPSHSSAPHLGRNAVLDMMHVIQAVEDLALPEHPLIGKAINALTDIISDPYPGHSVIPTICRATYDRRLLPGETPADVLDPIRNNRAVQAIDLDAIIGTGTYTAFTGNELVCNKFFPAWLLPEEDAFVRLALQSMEKVGLSTTTSTYGFCTNAAYSIGRAGVPTIGLGPAREEDAHVINEQLKLDELIAVAHAYRAIIETVLA